MRHDSISYSTWLIHTCAVTHSYATWLIHTCDVTHSYAKWLIHTCDVTHSYAAWLIHTCDVTHSYVWHDTFICVTWLIHTCDMTHSYVWHDSFICVTWRIHMCVMTHSYVWHDSLQCVTWLIHTQLIPQTTTLLLLFVTPLKSEWVMSHIWMSHDTLRNPHQSPIYVAENPKHSAKELYLCFWDIADKFRRGWWEYCGTWQGGLD